MAARPDSQTDVHRVGRSMSSRFVQYAPMVDGTACTVHNACPPQCTHYTTTVISAQRLRVHSGQAVSVPDLPLHYHDERIRRARLWKRPPATPNLEPTLANPSK